MTEPAFLWTMFNGTEATYILLHHCIVVEARFVRNQYDGAKAGSYDTQFDARTVALQLTENWEDHGYDLHYIRMHRDPARAGVTGNMLHMLDGLRGSNRKVLESCLHGMIQAFYTDGEVILIHA